MIQALQYFLASDSVSDYDFSLLFQKAALAAAS